MMKAYRTTAEKKRRRKIRRVFTRVLTLLLIVALSALIILAVFFGIKALVSAFKEGDMVESHSEDSAIDQQSVNSGNAILAPDSSENDCGSESELANIPESDAEPAVYEDGGAYYIDIEGNKVLIVNKTYALSSDFGGINTEADAALTKMFTAAATDGINLWLVSGYRSYESQASIHQGWVNTYGIEYANKISAEAGHSEHQTGMAFDINSLSTGFSETEEYRWLQANCALFGFIERYPYDKEWATGYNYEPWHYRYIGSSVLAQNIMDSGLSLEEYAGIEEQVDE